MGDEVLQLDTNKAKIKSLKNNTHVIVSSDDTSVVLTRHFKVLALAIVEGCITVNLHWLL